MNALIYCRVSTTPQDNERQIIQIEKYCRTFGYEIAGRYYEKISGTIDERDELTRLLNDVKQSNFDYVIVSELSRLGRNVEVINTIKTIHSCETGFISIKEGIKTDVKDIFGLQAANLLIGVLASINTFELSTLRSRFSTGLYRSILNGGVTGTINLPYGYKKLNKKLVINPSEAEIIKDIFRLHLEGNGTARISNILNERGVKTRSELNIIAKANIKECNYKLSWVDGTIYSMLKNTIYKGVRKFKGEEIIQESLRIIDDETFKNVQTNLEKNYNKAGKHRNPNFTYIISRNKIFCGICGLTYFPHKRESGKDNRYICLSKRYKNSCENYGISIDKIEILIHEVIFYIFAEKLENILNNTNLQGKYNEKNKEIIKTKKEIEKLRKTEGNVLNWLIEKKFSEETIDNKLKELNITKNSLNSKLHTLEKENQDLSNKIRNLKDIKKIKSNYKGGEKLSKQVIDKIITKIIITKQDKEIWNKCCPEKSNYDYDKILEVKLIIGNEELRFLISQRTKHTFYIVEEFEMPMAINDFFSGRLPHKAFDFLTGRKTQEIL